MSETSSKRTGSEKEQQILCGARAVFHRDGFDGASVDEIASEAGVSKATLYKYFSDKRQLFMALAEHECHRNARETFEVHPSEQGVEQCLQNVARNFVRFINSDFAISMVRLVTAEAARFPELGRRFYESGPDLGQRRLGQLLAAAVARHELDIDDIDLAAAQFCELCKSDLQIKRLLGVKPVCSEEEYDRVADGAVRTFMRAYAPRTR